MILGAILSVSLTVLLIACSKKKDCECQIEYMGQSTSVSFSDYDGECSSISFSEIVNHVGGDATSSAGYHWHCYER